MQKPKARALLKSFLAVRTLYELTTLLNQVNQQHHICPTMEINPKQMHRYAYPIIRDRDARYVQFRIPKKSGGHRVIHTPHARLKVVQRCLNVLLELLYTPTQSAHGFVHGRSVVSNAAPHIQQPDVFNTDIADFFPSITLPKLVGCLSNYPYQLDSFVAHFIAHLCCIGERSPEGKLRFVLPQGAPTSPVLSNIVCRGLDLAMEGLARKYALIYTRYADDITFSGKISRIRPQLEHDIRRILAHHHFHINESKTRCQHLNQRQEVTGLIVNQKANTQREYVREIRQMLYIWEHYGLDELVKKLNERTQTGGIDPQNHLLGKLNYLKMVKGENKQYERLLNQFNQLCDAAETPPYHYETAKFKHQVRQCCRQAPLHTWYITLDAAQSTCTLTHWPQAAPQDADEKRHIPLSKICPDPTQQEFNIIFLYAYRTFRQTGRIHDLLHTLQQAGIL